MIHSAMKFHKNRYNGRPHHLFIFNKTLMVGFEEFERGSR